MPDNGTDPLAFYSDFHRLASNLTPKIVDFDYYRTRKMLEPNWNGYDMDPGHDIRDDDCNLLDANVVTSQTRNGNGLHKIVLDLDYGVTQQLGIGLDSHRMVLHRHPTARHVSANLAAKAFPAAFVKASPGPKALNLDPLCDYALIPSTSANHHHLILDCPMPWQKYMWLLRHLAAIGILETGYVKASIARGFTAIRPPWIKKPKTQEAQCNPTTSSDSPTPLKPLSPAPTGPAGNPKPFAHMPFDWSLK